MNPQTETDPDLMPPAFAEGLDDWSSSDGTPDSPTYDRVESARIALNDRDFGACLELRKTDPVQRLRYMGEVPIRPGSYVEIAARIKALRGPLPTCPDRDMARRRRRSGHRRPALDRTPAADRGA